MRIVQPQPDTRELGPLRHARGIGDQKLIVDKKKMSSLRITLSLYRGEPPPLPYTGWLQISPDRLGAIYESYLNLV